MRIAHSDLDAFARALAPLIAAELRRPSTGPSHMTAGEYAARIGVSVRTTRSWIAAGMPSVRAGRVRRIIVADADRWLADGGARGSAARAGRAAARRAAMRAVDGGRP